MASVDVFITSYQYARFLEASVRSALAEDVPELRVVIIDNASTDGSVALARRLAAEDPRVEVVEHATNLGPKASTNEAISLARADYMMILCADDVIAPGGLRESLRILEANPRASFAHGRDLLFQDAAPPTPEALARASVSGRDWRVLPSSAFIEAFCAEPFGTVSILVRMDAQRKAGFFRPELRYTDDTEMMLRLALLGDVAQTRGCLVLQRLHGANISADCWGDKLQMIQVDEAAILSFFSHEGSALPDAARLRTKALRALARRAFRSALSRAARGEWGDGAGLLRYAAGRTRGAQPEPGSSGSLTRPDLFGRMRAALSRATGGAR